MCKMMNEYLDNFFGSENTISEIDLLVAEDEALCMNYVERKANRKARRKAEALKKAHRKTQYQRYGKISNYAHRTMFDKGYDQICPIFHGADQPVAFVKKGKKYEWDRLDHHVENRKVRHQKFAEDRGDFFEEDVIDPYTGELLAEKGEPIRPLEFSNEDKEHLREMFYRLNPEDREEELFQMGFNNKYEFEGFDFHDPEMYQDRRLNEKLISARRLIKAYKDLLELELQRATLMSLVHEVEVSRSARWSSVWKIRIAVAEFNKANRNCK